MLCAIFESCEFAFVYMRVCVCGLCCLFSMFARDYVAPFQRPHYLVAVRCWMHCAVYFIRALYICMCIWSGWVRASAGIRITNITSDSKWFYIHECDMRLYFAVETEFTFTYNYKFLVANIYLLLPVRNLYWAAAIYLLVKIWLLLDTQK